MVAMESEQDARSQVMGAGDSQMNLANVSICYNPHVVIMVYIQKRGLLHVRGSLCSCRIALWTYRTSWSSCG